MLGPVEYCNICSILQTARQNKHVSRHGHRGTLQLTGFHSTLSASDEGFAALMSPWRHSLKCAAQRLQRARSRSKQPIAGLGNLLKSFPDDPSHDWARHSAQWEDRSEDRCHGLWSGSIRDWDKKEIREHGFLPPRGLMPANRLRYTQFTTHPARAVPPSTIGLPSQALRSFSSAGKLPFILGTVSTSHCEDSSASTGPAPGVPGSPNELSGPSGATVLSDGGVSEIAAATAESSAPIAIVQQLIDQLHVASGLPW